MVEKNKDRDLFEFKWIVSPENIKKTSEIQFTDYQVKIAELSDRLKSTLRKQQSASSKATDQYVEQILDLCIDNGVKIYYISPNIRAVLPEDEIKVPSKHAEAVFNFVKSSEGTKYFLSASSLGKTIPLRGKELIVLSNSPCNIVIDKTLMRFKNINANKLTPFVWKDHISVEKRVELEYYKKFVKNAIATDAIVKATGFKIINLDNTPKAIISVVKDITGGAVICLRFKYGDIEFDPTSLNTTVVRFDENGGDYRFTKLTRDLQAENEIETAAAEILGGREKPGTYRIRHYSKLKNLEYDCAVDTITSNIERLAEAGISTDVTGGKKIYNGKIKLNLRVEQINDWFDIYAMVELDGIKIPFIALRPYLLNNIREFPTKDGLVVILPEEWFEKYNGLLSSGIIDRDSNSIKLYKYQYDALSTIQLDAAMAERIENLKASLADPEGIPLKHPSNVHATLRPYQTTAFSWLMMMRDLDFGACLADDMGLGKTLCTLSLLSESMLEDEDGFHEGLFSFNKKIPSLLVVPKSLIYNWTNEAKKFTPQLRILEFIGNNRLETIKSFGLYDIVITGYATLRNDVDELSKLTFNYIVLDESQTVKNSSSKTYQSLMQLRCRHRLALTGTPLENSLTDIWSQINFINPGLLGPLTTFRRYYVNPIEKKLDEKAAEKLKAIITPFMLRRTKQQVLDDLPDLMEQTILCEMTDDQQKIYEREKSRTRNSILEFMEQGTFEKSTVMVLQSLTKLRQIACTPSLTDAAYNGGSGKTDEIMRALQTVTAQGHKVLVFSSFVMHLNHIARQLDNLGIGYAMLTGETEHREDEVRKFDNEDIPAFLISIKAGGTGLNLTKADYVFIIDPWWNPAVENQAIARAHRIGQKNSVMVYRFISKATVEEKIQKFQSKKSGLASSFVTETAMPANLKDEVLGFLE